MNTLAWVFILASLVIARSVAKGRVFNITEDLSDAFKALLTGDQTSFGEVLGRTGASATASSGFTVGTSVGEAVGRVGAGVGASAGKAASQLTKPPIGYRNQIAWINAQGFSFKPTLGQTTGGTHVTNSYHYKGEAVDLSADKATMLRAARTIEAAFGHRITELIHTPLGYSIIHGKRVAPVKASDHYDHVHWAEDPKDVNNA